MKTWKSVMSATLLGALSRGLAHAETLKVKDKLLALPLPTSKEGSSMRGRPLCVLEAAYSKGENITSSHIPEA